jgi:hypothetical protein
MQDLARYEVCSMHTIDLQVQEDEVEEVSGSKLHM